MRLCGSLLLVIGHSSANVASCKTPCCAAERRPFLITGCGRCGSHAIARLFIQSGLDVRHEELGVDGAVHWGWAWWRDSLRGRALPAPFQTKERRSAVRYTDPDFRFRVVAHYVRHPLTSVQSLEKCFCGSPSRASVNGSKIDPVSEASYRIVATHQPGLPSGATHRAMFYWHATNAYLETRSDFRFRVEAVNTSELVGALGYNLSDDAVARSCADERASSSTRAAPSVSSSATWQHEWGRLAAVNSSLAQAMRAAAIRYGYDPDSPPESSAALCQLRHKELASQSVCEDARDGAHWARGDVARSIAQSSPSRSPLPRAQRDETRPSARSPTRSPVSITSTLKTTTPPPPSTTDSSSDDWVQKCLTDPRVQCADGRSCPTTPAPPRSCLRSSVPFRTPLARVRCCFRCCLMHWLEESGLARCVGSRAHAIGKRVKRVNELSYTHMRARARARNIEVNSATWAGGLELGRDPLTNVMVHRRCARAVVRAPCAPYPHLTLWLPNSTAPAQIVLGGGPRLRAQGREHGPLRESIDRPTGTCLFERGFFFINVWQMCCLWWRR